MHFKRICILNNAWANKLNVHTSSLNYKGFVPSNLKGKSTSSQKWLQRQLNDPYVKKARYEHYRCRSAFKLLEINEKYNIFKPGMTVIDCGAAPGSWSQVAVKCVNSHGHDKKKTVGKVFSIDIQHMQPVDGAMTFHMCDFTLAETQKKILHYTKNADIVMSDMAPKATGIRPMDHENIIELCFHAFKFALVVLPTDGSFVCKLWQGRDQPLLEKRLKEHFNKVEICRPPSSRSESAEIFYICTGYIGKSNSSCS